MRVELTARQHRIAEALKKASQAQNELFNAYYEERMIDEAIEASELANQYSHKRVSFVQDIKNRHASA